MRLKCWVVVDMEYKPHPVIVEACANREWCVNDAKERNEWAHNETARRFRVFTASTEVVVK